ncbi:hypothetical protein H5410_035387 [Solanum commersonii]|uniref:Uncharacterized protein n=1 Tax=Solanum commersonii TaxID=4109 RepID=A0A9J5Y0I9_SOLCO|nr:hypothetical protein H5410_035387 [Solanum commersonii]
MDMNMIKAGAKTLREAELGAGGGTRPSLGVVGEGVVVPGVTGPGGGADDGEAPAPPLGLGDSPNGPADGDGLGVGVGIGVGARVGFGMGDEAGEVAGDGAGLGVVVEDVVTLIASFWPALQCWPKVQMKYSVPVEFRVILAGPTVIRLTGPEELQESYALFVTLATSCTPVVKLNTTKLKLRKLGSTI